MAKMRITERVEEGSLTGNLYCAKPGHTSPGNLYIRAFPLICQSGSITHNFQAVQALLHPQRLSATGSKKRTRDRELLLFLLLGWGLGLGFSVGFFL